jgi:hypothetical protein
VKFAIGRSWTEGEIPSAGSIYGRMPDLAAASAGLIAALKGNDQETIAAAIEAAVSFDEKPGDDRQRLRGTGLDRNTALTSRAKRFDIAHCGASKHETNMNINSLDKSLPLFLLYSKDSHQHTDLQRLEQS